MENWAYGFSLNHEGAGVGTIYYSKNILKEKELLIQQVHNLIQ